MHATVTPIDKLKWPPSKIAIADSKEIVFALIQEGYRLCVEPTCSFMCEGYVTFGQDRPRIPVTHDAAESALEDKSHLGGLRQMTDDEVRKYLQLDPRNRKFYLSVM